jgi:hypothetical protein
MIAAPDTVMDPEIEQACLAEVRRAWTASAEGLRPDTAWIAEYLPVPAGTRQPDTSVVKAWLLSKAGIERRPADEYVRFLTVHYGLHWHSGIFAPMPSGVFNNRPGYTHTIGLAAFAPVEDSELIYLDYIWGGMFGRGAEYRYDAQAKALECVKTIWTS